MVKALFDTGILIDHLNRIEAATATLARFDAPAISVITWIEVMAGTRDDTELGTRHFLNRFEHIALDAAIAERAAKIRRETRIKIPDSIIWATALEHRLALFTRDRDFPADHPSIVTPYRL